MEVPDRLFFRISEEGTNVLLCSGRVRTSTAFLTNKGGDWLCRFQWKDVINVEIGKIWSVDTVCIHFRKWWISWVWLLRCPIPVKSVLTPKGRDSRLHPTSLPPSTVPGLPLHWPQAWWRDAVNGYGNRYSTGKFEMAWPSCVATRGICLYALTALEKLFWLDHRTFDCKSFPSICIGVVAMHTLSSWARGQVRPPAANSKMPRFLSPWKKERRLLKHKLFGTKTTGPFEMKSLQRRELRFTGIVAKTVLPELGAGRSFWVLGCEQSVPSCHLSLFSVVFRVGGELWRTWATHAPMQGPFSRSPVLHGSRRWNARASVQRLLSLRWIPHLTLADSGCIPTRTPSHLRSRLRAGGKWSNRSRSRGCGEEYFLLQDALPSGPVICFSSTGNAPSA